MLYFTRSCKWTLRRRHQSSDLRLFRSLEPDQGKSWVPKCELAHQVIDQYAKVQTKNRTKILIEYLAPKILKRGTELLVTLAYRKDKAGEGALYNLIMEHAHVKQHYFLMKID